MEGWMVRRGEEGGNEMAEDGECSRGELASLVEVVRAVLMGIYSHGKNY